MKHRSIYKIALYGNLVMLLTGGIACEKLVSVPANAGGQLVTPLIFTDSGNATAGVLGLYASNSISDRNVELYTGLTGDELSFNSVAISYQAMYQDSLTAGSAGTLSFVAPIWSDAYASTAIYQANAALEGLAADHDSTISTATRDQLSGECELVRAFHYFNLVNIYGGVPLVTTSFYETNQGLPRATVEAVYDQITKDLLDAHAKLSRSYPSTGRQRPNRYTADALLARVYLYRKQWDSAQVMADTVINSGLYSLNPSLDNVFLDGSKEAIWQLGSNSTLTPKSAPGTNVYYTYAGLAPIYALTPGITQAFETGDARLTKWVKVVTGYIISASGISLGTFSYPYKYRNSSGNVYNNTTEDLMMVRLAEMYLIRAEARARLGDLAGAMQDVNIIRSRAGLTTPVSAATLQDALGLILHERQVELFCEWGHRWMDLKRMDSINTVMTRAKPSAWPADGHTALYPISYGEILADPYLTQNPGYN